ncbi:hypothetical protein E2C01_091785 [Portunus trituberculatus]|uniref:Uncharacterized protein n=1 Tax=Portunus trituberculatus TaxID=210409 RepID=A0A5B7JJY1_PORTR|nr:hypothetical protein [Portunus trituberculatus]
MLSVNMGPFASPAAFNLMESRNEGKGQAALHVPPRLRLVHIHVSVLEVRSSAVIELWAARSLRVPRAWEVMGGEGEGILFKGRY